MSTEEKVASHYTHGSLETAILQNLSADGKDIDNLRIRDLAGVDEFHLGRHAATVDFARDLDLAAGLRLADIGSGLGGPATLPIPTGVSYRASISPRNSFRSPIR